MKKNKTAGIDGIPAEFWQRYDFMDEWLEKVFEEMYDRGMMTETMRMAVVKLIYKKNDRNDMANYRPISLLCTDYKLMAKIMTERMKLVLHKLIGKEQQGFIRDGNIKGNLMLVKEVIEYCNEKRK